LHPGTGNSVVLSDKLQRWTATLYCFVGEWGDPSGLIYRRARYYLPRAGIFTARDPFPGVATLPVTLQPYLYAAGNPVRYTDPSGQFIFLPLLAVAAVGGLIGGVGYYALQTNFNHNSCSRWDWKEAVFWGGVGTGLGALLGTGIFIGSWLWATYGPVITTASVGTSTSAPLTLSEKRSYWSKMYDVFLRVYPRFQKFVGTGKLSMHHRIPLQWSHLFPGVDPNRISNLYAVPLSIHQRIITPAWNAFAQANPLPSAAQVMSFAIEMDKVITEFINHIPE
jgi:RHS repeat-associated protein